MMKLKRVKWGPALVCGWVVILVSAAYILPSDSSIISAMAVPIVALMVVWLVLSVVALSLYFYRAWRAVAVVPNKAAYVTWIGIETFFAVAVLVGLAWFFTLLDYAQNPQVI